MHIAIPLGQKPSYLSFNGQKHGITGEELMSLCGIRLQMK
jgi:hypothetical protein